MIKTLPHRLHAPCVLAAWAVLLLAILPAYADPKLKVGFIYTGPISDFGWTHSHEQARLTVAKTLPWVETSYVESVSDGDIESYIDQMADQGIKVIFCTSATFMDGTISAAARHPDVIFFNASGYKQAPNVGTYTADAYQSFYLMGMASAALSKSGKIGYVSTYPMPESVRGVNSFTLGVRAVDPKAVVDIRWLNAWYDPPGAKEAAEALLAQGDSVLATDMDSPTVAQVAEAHHVPVNGHAFDAYSAAPHTLITGDIYNWAPLYIQLLQKVHDGAITPTSLQNTNLWWRLGDDAVKMYYQPGVLLNPQYQAALSAAFTTDDAGRKISVYDMILRRYGQMSSRPPQFEPFTGPLADADGKPRISPGKTATLPEMFSMTWRIAGIVGSWPNQ